MAINKLLVMGKFATAKRLFRTQGIAGITATVKTKYFDKWLGKEHNWFYGKLVEIGGNVIKIDGCAFSLDSPAIPTRVKSSFLFDEYEKPERQAIRRFLNPTMPVVEFGGSVGVVSCLTNRRLSDPRRHVVVEANPAMVSLLKRNRDLNHCQFDILPAMVGYGSDRGTFYANENFLTSSSILTDSRDVVNVTEVKTVNLSSILNQYQIDLHSYL